jgi:hypothetical protein
MALGLWRALETLEYFERDLSFNRTETIAIGFHGKLM